MSGSLTKILENMPIKHMPESPIPIFKVPVDESLGKDEKDFSNVTISAITAEGQVVAGPEVFFVPGGKLGTLKGGLLFLNDFRAPLSKDDVANMALECTKQRLSSKRKGWGLGTKCLF